jgi:hypothetical protein
MTLSLIKSPAAVSLVGNDILFKINTDNQYSAEGSKAVLLLDWSAGDSAGNGFTIAWGDFEIEFTAAVTPDESGLQYPSYVSGTLAAYKQSLINYLKANYVLSADFIIEYVTATSLIRFTAREIGTGYSLTPTVGTSHLTVSSNTAGTDPVVRDFYQILLRVWDSGPNLINPVLLGEDKLTPDEDGNVRFKIQEYLKPEITPDFTYPESNASLVNVMDMVKEFFIEYAETYDGDVKRLYTTIDDKVYAIGGKISIQKEAVLNELEMTFYDELIATKMFLSWHPKTKTIGKWQPEKLYFLMLEETTSIWVFAEILYTDGTSAQKTLYSGSVDQYSMLEICCGHDIMNLQYGKAVESYQVYVNKHGSTISEIKEFIIDQDYKEYENVFIFLNSLGVYETLRTTGVLEKENEFEHTLIEKGVTSGDLSYYEESSLESFMEETFKANSGWVTKDVLDWTNDFMMSRDRYIIEDYQLFKIIVTSKKVFQHRSDEYLYSIEFEFKKSAQAAYSNMFSMIPIITEEADLVLSEDSEITLIE